MSIKKVVQSSASQQVSDQLREQIQSGSWKPGAQPTPAHTLAALLTGDRV